MWIAPISYSNRSTAVIAEAIEVDSKPFESILPFVVSVTCACMNKLHCIPCLLFVLKIVCAINFRGFHYPRKFFNNEIFADYGILYACIENEDLLHSSINTVHGEILVGYNIGEWVNSNQLEGKILVNELHGYTATTDYKKK